MPVTAPVRKATLRPAAIEPSLAAAAVRTLPRTAVLMPMYPASPDRVAPTRKARVRNRPDIPKESTVCLEPSGRVWVTLLAVTKTRTASGTTMIPMALNCRAK